ncbi:MAG TPA: DUF389 domain-containing protein [Allosphingosinicella sp.]|nr:DUF389 domain-containing protein [Allosphingosinicella sp.]
MGAREWLKPLQAGTAQEGKIESELEASKKRLNPLSRWWASSVVSSVRHAEVIGRVHEDSGWSNHYAFMTVMSAGIAVLGLLLSSPAVVIGAMLISPLMGPIVGLGFAIATFDSVEMRRALAASGLGVALAVGFCGAIVLLSPLQTVTDEIAARTRPNLFDLLVALFSGLAGSYAMIRGRHGAIVGVAIATALMPPLATIGFGLATLNWTVFWGSSLLFFTNFVVVSVAAAIMARLYHFGQHLSPKQTRVQAALIIAVFLSLGLPLSLSLRQIAWETLASRQARDTITSHFGEQARLSEIDIDYDSRPIAIEATVLTPTHRPDAERQVAAMLEPLLRRPVKVTIDQFRVGAEGDVQSAEIAAARGRSEQRRNSRIAERLALVAGVSPDQVLVDGTNSRAEVRAARLPGADVQSYRVLERRVAAVEPGWNVSLVPPAAPLPDISFAGEAPDEAGIEALAAAAWAAQRLRLPIEVSGASEARARAVVEALREAGVDAQRGAGGGNGGRVRLRWMAPEPLG